MDARPTLYDATGTVIPIPAPPPEMFGGMTPPGVEQTQRDRYRDYPSKNLTPQKITEALELMDAGEPYLWVQLCEEITEKDPKIGSVLQTRTAAVLGTMRQVLAPQMDEDAADRSVLAEEIAKFVEKAVESVNFSELLGDMLDAIGKPFAIDWIEWGFNADGKIVPTQFRRIPSRHIRWSYKEDVVRVWSPSGEISSSPFVRAFQRSSFFLGNQGADLGEPLPPYTTVRALNNARRDHPTRAGLLRTLVWYYLFKNIALKDWVSYGDRYGMPIRLIKLDQNDFQNPEMYGAARRALRDLGTDASGVIRKDSELEVIATGSKGGGDLFNALIDYIDKAVAQAVLGHELTSQGSKGGGNLGISAALQVRQDILEGDCEWLNAIIKRDLFTPLVGWNFGWENVDLTPELGFDYEPPADLVSEASVLRAVAGTFPELEFSRQQVREKFGLDEPLESSDDDGDSDVLMPGSSAPAAVPGDATNIPPEPGTPEAPPPGTPINSRLENRCAVLHEHGETCVLVAAPKKPKRLPKPKQSRIDRLAAKGKAVGLETTASWKAQLRDLLREAQKEGLGAHELSMRIVKAYPDLNVADLERTLREQMLLTRLFGRNTARA